MTIKKKLVRHRPMLSVAITGAPASGKSTALEEFRRAGFETVDADVLARREFYRTKNLKSIKKIFGTTDRKKIAEIIFADDFLRKKLEDIIHPGVIKELKFAIRRARKENKPFAAEVPLLFEKKLDRLFDVSVAVFSSASASISRLRSKKISTKTARLMIKAHMSPSEKARLADFVLINKSSINSLSASSRKLALSLID